MSKINQFTFSQDYKYIMNTALDVFGDELCVRDGHFLFSTENEKFIDYISELYGNSLRYCLIKDYYSSLHGRRNDMEIDPLKSLPVYGFISYNEISNYKEYKEDQKAFEDILSYDFGIECHYDADLIPYGISKLVERIYDEQNKPIYV